MDSVTTGTYAAAIVLGYLYRRKSSAESSPHPRRGLVR